MLQEASRKLAMMTGIQFGLAQLRLQLLLHMVVLLGGLLVTVENQIGGATYTPPTAPAPDFHIQKKHGELRNLM